MSLLSAKRGVVSYKRVTDLAWRALAIACIAMGALVRPVAAADFVMMTAPSPPVAGEPWSLVFAASVLGDLDPSTGPVVEVVGDRLRVRPRAECNQPYCDVFSEVVFRVDIPPLPAGRYTVEVASTLPDDFATMQPFSVDVNEGPTPSRLRPVDGFWSEPMKPGRGLSLQVRGNTVGFGMFDMQPSYGEYFEPIWQIDAPSLRGDSLVAAPRRPVRQFSAPSCLGCPQPNSAPLALATIPMRLRFESERRAWLDLGDGSSHPLISLPYGADYVSAVLTDTVDGDFGALPLPNLQGRWLFDLPQGARVIALSAPQIEAGRVTFTGDGVRVECRSATATERAGCALQNVSPAWFARLGDVSETRMRFRPAAGAVGAGFYAEKLTPP